MARCGCSGASCSCVVQGGGGVTVTGAGSVSNPYLITSDLNLQVADSSTVDLSLSGDGSDSQPFILSAAAAIDLNALTDVDTTGGTTGQVLALQADGTYRLVAPTTAATGTVNVSSTGGIQGDATSGNPLAVKLAPSSGLIADATGLRLSSGGAWTAWTPVLTASSTNPTLGNGSIEGTYVQQGKMVTFSIELIIGSTTKRGVGYWMLSLPVPPTAARDQVVPMQVAAVGSADYVGNAKIQAGKLNRLFIATSTAAQALSHSTPSAMGSGSAIIITGTYEAA